MSVIEGNSGSKNITFTISLSAATSNSVSVTYSTANNTATAPSDYTSKSGTITFASGTTSRTVTVSVKGERTAEPTETFFVNLSNAVNGTIADGQGICTIVDND